MVTPFYRNYIKGPKWAARKKDWYKKHGKFCRACGRIEGQLHLHHLTYERLGNELDIDLTCLCKGCHSEVTKLSRANKRRFSTREVTQMYIVRKRKSR